MDVEAAGSVCPIREASVTENMKLARPLLRKMLLTTDVDIQIMRNICDDSNSRLFSGNVLKIFDPSH